MIRSYIIAILSMIYINFAIADDIKTIAIQGNKRIENFTIQTFLGLKAGDRYDEERLNRALKNVYASGLFASVDFEFKSGVLKVKVEENPLVNKVIFEGNTQLKTDDLNKDLFLKPRSVFSKNKFIEDMNRIKNIYAKNGRLNAKIVPKIVELSDNRLNLIYEINEGKKTLIRRIIFIGNRIFTDSELRASIASKQYNIFKLFSSGTQFDEERLEFDKELLRKFYASHGYADFKTSTAIADFSKFDNSITLTFIVEEGERYNISEVKVVNELREIKNEQILAKIGLKKGSIFNDEKIREDEKNILKLLSSEGFPFSDVEVNFQRDVDAKEIEVTYIVKPSSKIYLNKINIAGNSRTFDYVIRREFGLAEGDPFNISKIEEAKERIIDLGYFSGVDITQKKTKYDDKIDLEVKVKEKSTASIKLAGGYSTSDRIFGKIGFVEKNLFGRGQEASIEFIRYLKKYDIDFSFTEPYFMNKPLAAGFDFLTTTQEKDKFKSMNYSFQERLLGVRAAYNITDHLSHLVRYTNKYSNVKDISASTSDFIKDQKAKARASAIGQSFTYDKRNSILTPTTGYLAKIDQEVAGIGGNSKYIKHEGSIKFFYPIGEKVIFNAYGKFGYIKGLGKERVLINDRFFNSETDVKGFEERGIGPRDKLTAEALGGNKYVYFGSEASFPIGLANDLDIKGHVFLEAGMVSGLDLTKDQKSIRSARINESSKMRVTTGFGIKWITRMGPLRFDIPVVLNKQKFDKTQKFIFSIEQPL
jgi:outer membrane protein insertion porin family